MPQMRAVRSGASLAWRPRRNASKKRGGSKISRRRSVTLPCSTVRCSAPSPSTRASAPTWMLLVLSLRDGIAGFPQWAYVAVDAAQAAHGPVATEPLPFEQSRKGGHVRIVGGAEAAVAAAMHGRADGPAPGAGDRPQTRLAARDHDAHRAPPLAFHADAVRRQRRFGTGQERAHDGEQLLLVDRAAPDLVVDPHVLRDRRRGGQRGDELGARIDD